MSSLAWLGRPSLAAAAVLAAAGIVLFALAAIRNRRDIGTAACRSVYASAFFVVIAAGALMSALVTHDFSLEYVVNYTSRSLTGPYTISALWGGMEGSLLFWTLLLTLFSGVALKFKTQPAQATALRSTYWAGAVLATIAAFFLLLLLIPADPFTVLADPPVDGRGLNPLLQSPGMLIHPPLLYTGFVGFSIPFAFGIGALLAGRLDDGWFRSTRRWTLFAWSALSVGIVLGGAWAYTELGWGGYWAWDPVENASFMPWLTATAFLHSVIIQEKRRMFKVWNVSLILMTYALAVFGTFLTRSGLLSSIHTFTEGPIGKWFLPFLALMLIGGFAVVAWRYDSLRSENRFDSLLSRESAFLANNVLFLSAAFAVLWGTMYPIVAEITSGVRLSVGPPFFNSVFIPIALALIGLTGIGPLISWRRMSSGLFGRAVRGPLIGAAAVIGALAGAGVRSTGALLAFGLCMFTSIAIVMEFVRGSAMYRRRDRLGWPSAVQRTLLRNRRRYGGYVVHLGVVLIVVGLAGAAFRTERQELLAVGESMNVGAYRLVYDNVDQTTTSEKTINTAFISVFRGDERVTSMEPQRNFHHAQQQPQSEVAIRTTPIEDLYVVVTSFDEDGAAAVRAFVNPLTWWIWSGAAVMALGIGLLLTEGVRAPVRVSQPATVREAAVATR
ncbi:MAG: heme lyase CcmF/NrfE family subunit [Actinomycetota bacterium]|nr:heme lyase CcmF/NrfE family subunit [Actinomycetota bacterium]